MRREEMETDVTRDIYTIANRNSSFRNHCTSELVLSQSLLDPGCQA